MCWGGYRSWDLDERRTDTAPEPAGADMRASDADRQRVIAQLRTHTADGRLTLDEFEARVEEAWRATTHAELRHVLRELPVPEVVRPVVSSPRRRQRVDLPVPVMVVMAIVAISFFMTVGWWLIPLSFWMVRCFGGHRRVRPYGV